MKKQLLLSAALLNMGLYETSFADGTLSSVFSEGSVSGNIRAYYNTREFSDSERDEEGFALGGALHAETGNIGLVSLGLTYYTAQDMDLNDDDLDEVNKRLGVDIEVLGEAYIKIAKDGYSFKAGRQKVDGPFANAGDAFITPFTFNGYTFDGKLTDKWSIDVDYLTSIRNRNSEDFVNVGDWSTGRYGVSQEGTSGTLNLGATYKADNLKTELWFTQFADLFSTLYFNAFYDIPSSGSVKPFVGFQYATQSESGDELIGDVDSTLLGIQGGIKYGKAKFTLGYNDVSENDSFNNGAFLTPYNFSTSPIFTNNMLTTLENVDSGDAIKATFNYAFTPQIAFKLSYATFDYTAATDREALDVDLKYSFTDYLKGLSLRYRLEVVTADVDSTEVTNHRFQMQFAF